MFAQTALHASWPILLVIFIASAAFTVSSKKVADFLFTPKKDGHPLIQVFKVIAYFVTWIFAPIATAAIAMFSLIALISVL